MQYLDGKKIQKNILDELKTIVKLLDIKPTLAVISIGNNPVNDIFFKQKQKMCEEVGYEMILHHYEEISESSLLTLIDKLNTDPKITSILLELPIPTYLPSNKIKNRICPKKDVEGITLENQMKVQTKNGGFIPCTALGIINLLNSYNINIDGENIVIINRSDIIGKPLLQYFLSKDSTVTMCHSKTKNLQNYLKNADIIISATGCPNLINAKFLKDGSIVIDAGTCYQDEKIIGDVNREEANPNIKYITPLIGGVGPMTIASLAENILKSYYLQTKNKDLDESGFEHQISFEV